MLLLSAAGVDPEDVVGDYMASIENNVARAASENRHCPEGELEQLCHRHGTRKEGAFRTALAGADMAGSLAQGEPATRAAVLPLRGHTSTQYLRVPLSSVGQCTSTSGLSR